MFRELARTAIDHGRAHSNGTGPLFALDGVPLRAASLDGDGTPGGESAGRAADGDTARRGLAAEVAAAALADIPETGHFGAARTGVVIADTPAPAEPSVGRSVRDQIGLPPATFGGEDLDGPDGTSPSCSLGAVVSACEALDRFGRRTCGRASTRPTSSSSRDTARLPAETIWLSSAHSLRSWARSSAAGRGGCTVPAAVDARAVAGDRRPDRSGQFAGRGRPAGCGSIRCGTHRVAAGAGAGPPPGAQAAQHQRAARCRHASRARAAFRLSPPRRTSRCWRSCSAEGVRRLSLPRPIALKS